MLTEVRKQLLAEEDHSVDLLDEAFADYDREQPVLARRLGKILARPLSEAALALGYFLSLSVWLAFQRAFSGQLSRVSQGEVEATEQLVLLDEDLRRNDPSEHLDTDDVILMEQPALVRFVHEHIAKTLDLHEDSLPVPDLLIIYRSVLTQILCLSYAVSAPQGYPVTKTEVLA